MMKLTIIGNGYTAKFLAKDDEKKFMTYDEFYKLSKLDVLVISDSEGIVMNLSRICEVMKDLSVLNLSYRDTDKSLVIPVMNKISLSKY